MLSAVLMFQRVSKAFRYAVREDEFLNVFFAGLFLIFIGTLSYALGADWNVVDALYQLIGIGILVEILRRLGFAFVAVRAQEKAAEKAP